MNTKIFFTALFSYFLFTSCDDNKDSSKEEFYVNNLQQQQILQQQQKQQQKQQMYIDSINRAKTIADSIERERKIRLIEEDKQMKAADAIEIIKSFSTSFMERVSPATGKNLTYNILYEESIYDELTSTMNVVFETSWDAVPDFNWNSPYQAHTYKGKIILYGTGKTRQQEISKNDVLIRAIKASSTAEDIISWLNKNSDNNSN